MTGLPLGPFKEVFQAVEERFPRYGRKLTSCALLVSVVAIILAGLAFIAGIVSHALLAVGVTRFPTFPLPGASTVFWIAFGIIVFLMGWASFHNTVRGMREEERKEQRADLMLKLLEEIRDKLH